MTKVNNITLASLNLWRYYDWETRKTHILNTVKRIKPDVFVLQEVQLNESFSPYSQAHWIANNMGFENVNFSPVSRKVNQLDIDGGNSATASHGLAVISKYPIVSSENVILKQHAEGDELRSVQMSQVLLEDGHKLNIYNGHFSNNDKSAQAHLMETLNIAKLRREKPIILGDLDIKLENMHKLKFDHYMSSAEFKDYISFPKDDNTYDYILLPEKYEYIHFECINDYLSDHRLIYAHINLNKN